MRRPRGGRLALGLIGLSLVLLGGCTSTIPGTATAAGEAQRTTEESEEPDDSESDPPESESEPEEPQEAETPEDVACTFASITLVSVALLFDTVVIDEIPLPGAPPNVPSPLREDVAMVLDAILADTQPMLDALAPGPIRDAFTVLRTESTVLRDALRAPATGPVPDTLDDPLTTTANDNLAATCRAR